MLLKVCGGCKKITLGRALLFFFMRKIIFLPLFLFTQSIKPIEILLLFHVPLTRVHFLTFVVTRLHIKSNVFCSYLKTLNNCTNVECNIFSLNIGNLLR